MVNMIVVNRIKKIFILFPYLLELNYLLILEKFQHPTFAKGYRQTKRPRRLALRLVSLVQCKPICKV